MSHCPEWGRLSGELAVESGQTGKPQWMLVEKGTASVGVAGEMALAYTGTKERRCGLLRKVYLLSNELTITLQFHLQPDYSRMAPDSFRQLIVDYLSIISWVWWE